MISLICFGIPLGSWPYPCSLCFCCRFAATSLTAQPLTATVFQQSQCGILHADPRCHPKPFLLHPPLQSFLNDLKTSLHDPQLAQARSLQGSPPCHLPQRLDLFTAFDGEQVNHQGGLFGLQIVGSWSCDVSLWLWHLCICLLNLSQGTCLISHECRED